MNPPPLNVVKFMPTSPTVSTRLDYPTTDVEDQEVRDQFDRLEQWLHQMSDGLARLQAQSEERKALLDKVDGRTESLEKIVGPLAADISDLKKKFNEHGAAIRFAAAWRAATTSTLNAIKWLLGVLIVALAGAAAAGQLGWLRHALFGTPRQ